MRRHVGEILCFFSFPQIKFQSQILLELDETRLMPQVCVLLWFQRSVHHILLGFMHHCERLAIG